MSLQTVLTQVESWPVEDRLRLMEQIWNGLVEGGTEPTLTEPQKAEIDSRLADDEAAPGDVVPWEVVKRAALGRTER